MRRFLLILLILSYLCVSLHAQGRGVERIFYGTEWGIGVLAMSHDDQVFITEEGYIVDYQRNRFRPHIRGNFSLFGGYRITDSFDASVYTGIEGLGRGIRVFPVGIRLAYTLPDDPAHSFFAAFAKGIPESGLEKPANLFKAGYAHNIDIGYGTTLRFLLSGKYSYAHPEIFDRLSDRTVPSQDVRKSDSMYFGADISIALVF